MRLRLSCSGPVELSTRDGTVVAALESVTVNLDLTAFRAISDGRVGTIGVGVDVSENDTSTTNVKDDPSSPVEGATKRQVSMLPDPVDETWRVYVEALNRPRAVLTPKVRKWIADAHKAVGVDETQRAIRGLAASDYHRRNGYVGIEYAIVPQRGQTIEGRVAKMVARVPQGNPNGLISVAQLIERFPAEHRSRIQSETLDVIEAMPATPDGPADRDRYDRGQAQLRRMRDFGFEIVIDDNGHIAGARKR